MILWLAPMDWWTDSAMRIVTKRVFDKYNKSQNELFLWTEFMHAHWYLLNPINLSRHIFKADFEVPLIAQIFWWEWEYLEKTFLELDKKYWENFYWIEINMWCPANKVVNSGWWSGMLKDKKKSLEIIKKIRSNYGGHFSIKTRTWLDDVDKNRQMDFLLEVWEICDMISVHWRTFQSGYAGDADRDFIYGLKNKLLDKWSDCKIIWNWWIKEFSDIEKFAWNLDWVMIGQWAMWNPWIFVDHEASIEDKKDVILTHLDMFVRMEILYEQQRTRYEKKWWSADFRLDVIKIDNLDLVSEKDILDHEQDNKLYSVIEFRKHLFNYVKGIEDSKWFKVKCSQINNYNELKDEIISFFG